MRPLHALLVVALLAGAIGCSLIDKGPDSHSNTTIQKMPADRFVTYLNERASRLQAVNADVRFTAHDGLLSMSLHGDLSAQQPRNFRMTGTGNVGGRADLGSNSEQFWIYVDAPTQKPLYVYASHTDFEKGIAKLPGGIPFEPEWVMQALGMHIFPPNLRYNEPAINTSERTYTLSWHATTPSGMTVLKEVVFEADVAREGKPQVKKHVIRDTKNNKVICYAEVKSVKSVPIPGPDPRSAPLLVQCPTQIVLHWEIQKFELDLSLTNVQVNQRFSEEQARRIFSRPPEFPGAPGVDLSRAKYEFSGR
jgi:hypothetical protein